MLEGLSVKGFLSNLPFSTAFKEILGEIESFGPYFKVAHS